VKAYSKKWMAAMKQRIAIGFMIVVIVCLTACGQRDAAATRTEGTSVTSPQITQPIRDLTEKSSHEVRAMQLITETTGWVLTDSQLLLITNGGSDWTEIELPGNPPALNIRGLFFADPAYGWAVVGIPSTNPSPGMLLSVMRTPDGGKTWIENQLAPADVEYEGSIANISIDFVDTQNGWIMVPLASSSHNISKGHLFHTVDGGLSWTKYAPPIGAPVRFTTPSDGWLAGGPAGDQLYVTHDSGQTWEPRSVLPPTTTGPVQVAYGLPDFQNTQEGTLPVAFAGPQDTMVGFYITQDGGASWTNATTLSNIASIDAGAKPPATIINSNTWLLTLASGETYKTNNKGAHWDLSSASNVANQASDPASASVVGYPDGIIELHFATDQIGWARRSVGTCAQFKTDCSMKTEVISTRDGGKTWTTLISLNTKI
jgi:photosystem II stability/assembly factor-like uncharacterized protein